MTETPINPLVVSALIFGGTLALSYGGTHWYLRWALRHQVLDQPNSRSSHRVPTPRGGGVGIVLAVLLNLFLWAWHRDFSDPVVIAFGLGALLLAAVSWLDDLRGLSALLRLAVQIGTALGVVLALGASPGMAGWPMVTGWLTASFLTVWIVTHVNFYNFMDGIDGLAACQSAVAGLAWMIAGWWLGEVMIAGLGCALLAATLAFLFFNWPPARIFMGDVGAAFLGFFSGTLPLLSPVPRLADTLVFAALVSAPFLVDASMTIVKRLINRENLLQAHRSHQYQRLVATGWSHRRVTLIYAGWALASGASGLCWLADIYGKYLLAGTVLILPEVSLAILIQIRSNRTSRNIDQ